MKGAQSKPNPSPNAFPKRKRDTYGSLFERKILGNYEWVLSVDYQWELSLRIMRERERERKKKREKERKREIER